jgi:hypothetical protein
MKRTPGPWRNQNDIMIFGKETSRAIARICALPNNEDIGNARLISAAPELLKALKELKAEIDGNYIGTGANDENGSMEEALIYLSEQAAQAILKAEGIRNEG